MIKHGKKWLLIILLPFFLIIILIVMMISMFGGSNNKKATMDLDCANNLNVQGNSVSKDQEKKRQTIMGFSN